MSTLLIIDDSKAARATTRMLLAGSSMFHRVLEARDGLEGLKVTVAERPDVVVCDLEMPLCDGRRFLALKSSRPDLQDTPVIMLTADDDPERKAELLVAGAADYVTKPFHPREILARVQVHLRMKLLREELLAANHHLAELSVTDGLTGLFNRRRFDEALACEVARALRYGLPLSLAMIDLDHFKAINDLHGHQVGDQVLTKVASVIRATARSSDVAARYGGEELCLVLPHTALSDGFILAERLRLAIASSTFEKEGVRVTASIGLAALSGPPQNSVASLIGAADAAVYAAKNGGRNRVHAAGSARTVELFARSELPTGRFRVARMSDPATSAR